MHTLSDAFWVLLICLIACFAFFFALGAFTAEAVGLLVVMGVLTLLSLGHAWLRSRHHGAADPRDAFARERRGF